MAEPKIEVLPIEQGATTDPGNINKHTARGGTLLSNSLQRRGAFRSIASAGKGVDVPVTYAGNYTLEKAVEAGFKEIVNVHVRGDQLVNVVRDDVAPGSVEAIALGLEDNESARQSYNPDIDMLAALAAGDDAILAQLRKEDKIFGGMLEGMGVRDETQDAEPQFDRAAELLEKWQVKTGDLWQIGEHRLLCGDSTKREDVERVMGGEKAQALICDPPFAVRDDEWDTFKNNEEFIVFTSKWLAFGKEYCDAIISFMADKNVPLLLEAAARVGLLYRRALIWRKPAGSQFAGASLDGFWYDFEIIQVFGKPTFKPSKNTKMAVLEYRTIIGQEHGAEKPIGLLDDLVDGYSENGAVVLDSFGGTGTVMVACQNLGRRCRAIEISPAYCAVILQRMQDAFPEIEIKRT